jgi:hypothetical protein
MQQVSILAGGGEDSEMKKYKPNPIPDQGSRNVFCPYYSDCLDSVIKRGWISWHCCLCGERSNEGARPEHNLAIDRSVAYYELPAGN